MSVQTVEAAEAVAGGCPPAPRQGRGAVPIGGSAAGRDRLPLARGRRTACPTAGSSAGRAGVIGFVGPRDAAPQAPAPSRLRRAAKAVRPHLGTLAGVTILGVLLWRLGTGVFLDGLRRIDVPVLLVGLGIGLLTTVFSAWRWALVARGLGIRLPLVPAIGDYYRSLFLNAALPGGVLGDVHRAVRHGQSAGDMGRGVRAVVLERAAGQVALIVVGGVVLLTQPSPVLAEARRVAPMVAFAAVGAVAVVVAVRMNRAPSSAARRARALRAVLTEARSALLSRENLPGVALSSVVVLSGHLGMFVVAARVAGSDASVAELLPLAVLALLAMGVPLNVGGWGPREGVTAWAFGAAGLGASMGLSVAVVYGVLSFVAALPGAVVLVVRYFWSPAPVAAPASASVSIEKYAPKDSAKLASNAFPFSAEPSEGRPMTPESV
ncbi:lysylphosphatidylglycerol synthase transmembrane domain-containing protein [Streptomyces lacrimifluminis]|uniref:Uncharacterized protein n=1 Tax=Streptomyces lacrimifluminis TaxID=1500077 RepID=A0A917L082_9ACTN|nr:hypothetical protein GCM10012282_39260 [Streptomyces lacrimifluminis]